MICQRKGKICAFFVKIFHFAIAKLKKIWYNNFTIDKNDGGTLRQIYQILMKEVPKWHKVQ